MSRGQLKLFSGSAHPALTAEIAEFLGVSPGHARLQRFPDTECSFQIDENIRGTDVFIVQPTCNSLDGEDKRPTSADEHIMELLIMLDAFRRSSASRITAVIPYYGYARQDRRPRTARVAIAAKLVADMITAAGADRVLTMDLHADQIQGFFDITDVTSVDKIFVDERIDIAKLEFDRSTHIVVSDHSAELFDDPQSAMNISPVIVRQFQYKQIFKDIPIDH